MDLDIEGYIGFIWTLWWIQISKVILDLSGLMMDLDIEGYSGFIWTLCRTYI